MPVIRTIVLKTYNNMTKFFRRFDYTARANAGFSLIELLVVATLIIILTTIGLVSYNRTLVNSRNAKRKADLEIMRQALVLYKLDNGRYPNLTDATFTAVQTAITSTYLQDVPTDPKNDATYYYDYDGTGTCNVSGCTTFTVTARLETDGTTYSVNSP